MLSCDSQAKGWHKYQHTERTESGNRTKLSLQKMIGEEN